MIKVLDVGDQDNELSIVARTKARASTSGTPAINLRRWLLELELLSVKSEEGDLAKEKKNPYLLLLRK